MKGKCLLLNSSIRRDGSSVSSLAIGVSSLRLQVTDAIQIMDGVCHLLFNDWARLLNNNILENS